MLKKKGLLLVNLGTPRTLKWWTIAKYLSHFLSDPRVIQLPLLLRYFLVWGVIVPFRTQSAKHAYQQIWTENGSPLQVYSEELAQKVQHALEKEYIVKLAMRYGTPSIEESLNQLKHCDEITILPLYPQYASSATGTAIEQTLSYIKKWPVIPSLKIIRDFYNDEGYIHAIAQRIKPYFDQQFILFSYHGVPENHLLNHPCSTICKVACDSTQTGCYRAQCYETSSLIARALGLSSEQYLTAFQSRLGRTEWIKPYTDTVLPQLIASGVKRLLVVCPSFVADCLETIEEIGIRAKNQWIELGGESFTLVPCLNDDENWIQAIIQFIQK